MTYFLPNRIFKDNVVTGYDFPELVENNGEALEKELGIEKQSFRKKIIRHIHARMLGIGTVPTPPGRVLHQLIPESCSTVGISWSRSTAKGFPVHSYRVQRRGVDLFGSRSGSQSPVGADAYSSGTASDASAATVRSDGKVVEGEGGGAVDTCKRVVENGIVVASPNGALSMCNETEFLGGEGGGAAAVKGEAMGEIPSKGDALSSVVPSSSNWVTVYHGTDIDFVDVGLNLGHLYVYRIQAWNSVGRSDWVTLDISKSLKKQKCTTGAIKSRSLFLEKASLDSSYRSNATSWPMIFFNGSYFFANLIYTLIRAVFALITFAVAFMRFRRATAKTTSSASLELPFPWFFSGMNAISARIIGVELIPRSVLGDKKHRRDESKVHDKEIKAVGLNGYSYNTTDTLGPEGENPRNKDSNGGQLRPQNRRVMFRSMRTKSHSTGNLAALQSSSEDDMVSSSSSHKSPAAAPKILRKKRARFAESRDRRSWPSNSSCGSYAAQRTLRDKLTFSRDSSVVEDNEDEAKANGSFPVRQFSKRVPKLRLRKRWSESDQRDIWDSSKQLDYVTKNQPMPPRTVICKDISTRTLLSRDDSFTDEEGDNSNDDVCDSTGRLSDRVTASERLGYEDDYMRCNFCQKKYKFARRFRHHCSRCTATFCHRHGRTTHSNLVSCRMPGDCVCNICLQLESFTAKPKSR